MRSITKRSYTFKAWGHPNILATHKNTLEFTKDKDLSLNGDCIVGLRANFSKSRINRTLDGCTKVRMTLCLGKFSKEIIFDRNSQFTSNHELVIRRSDYDSDRTLGLRCDVVAIDLPRNMVDSMKSRDSIMEVTLEPLYQVFVFDFDNTLEDFHKCKISAYGKLALWMARHFGVNEETTFETIGYVHDHFSHRGMSKSPKLFDRKLWFKDFFKRLNITPTKKDIDKMVEIYWDGVQNSAKLFPGTKRMLSKLSKRGLLVLMTDSDGNRKIKIDRVVKTGIYDYFDLIITSDETKVNKPHRKFYDIISKKIKMPFDSFVMIGDKPQVDLEPAKKLGIKTVWFAYGDWAWDSKGTRFTYVDHVIEKMDQLENLLISL